MSELIVISAVIGDRSYRIKVPPADEEMVRKSLKTINDRIIDFKTTYAGKDMQDYIAMALIWYATEQNTQTSEGLEMESLMDEVQKLDKMLDSHLAK